MSSTKSSLLLPFLYQALAAPIGIVLRSNDVERARAACYSARAKAGDAALTLLEIRLNPRAPKEEIMIVKKGASGQLAEGSRPANAPTLRDLGLED
jgi:hypothetical protein